MPQPEKTDLAQWLQGWRQRRGLTQDELAQAAGIPNKREIERYEKDTAPRGDTFMRLMSALGVKVEGMPQGPKAVNAEVLELRRELASLRRTLDNRLEVIGAALAVLAENQELGLDALGVPSDARAPLPTDTELPRAAPKRKQNGRGER